MGETKAALMNKNKNRKTLTSVYALLIYRTTPRIHHPRPRPHTAPLFYVIYSKSSKLTLRSHTALTNKGPPTPLSTQIKAGRELTQTSPPPPPPLFLLLTLNYFLSHSHIPLIPLPANNPACRLIPAFETNIN